MTSATDKTGCLAHRQNSHFFVMYEDFLDVAKVSEHQYKLAAFWRVLETKTNERVIYNEKIVEDAKNQGQPEPETNLWIEIPYSEFERRSLGVYRSSSFQVAAIESERLGFSESRTRKRPRNPLDPDSPLEEYKEYRFHIDTMQSVLNGGDYPTPIEINSPLLNSIAERKKKRAIKNNSTPVKNNRGKGKTPIESNSTPLLKVTGNNISPVSTTNNKEDTYTAPSSTPASSDANASTHTHSSSQDEPYTPDFSANHTTSQETPADEQQRASAPVQDVPRTAEISANAGQAELSTVDVEKPAEPVEKPKRTRAKKAAEPVLEFTEQGRKVYDAWCSLFKSPPRAAEKTIDCANELASQLIPWCKDLKVPCKDMLDEIRRWEYATDAEFYRKRGVTLCDIGRDFERWQSAKTHELDAKKPKGQPRKDNPLDEMRQQHQRYAQSERIGV